MSKAITDPMSQLTTLVDLLRWRAKGRPEQVVYRFLTDGESEEASLTYGELDREARAIGRMLQSMGLSGERALLLYPPGLEYIAAFFGCLYAGVVAVPAYPPDPMRLARTLPRLQTIVADAHATVALTNDMIYSMAQYIVADAPDLQKLAWRTTSSIADGGEDIAEGLDPAEWQDPQARPEDLAFLQYTSGSTGTPRGVMLSHGNLMHNLAHISKAFGVREGSRAVVWLPPYHDMGLIGGILEPLYGSVEIMLMSPMDFLQRPARWLEAIARFKADVCGGPNFAYDLCVRKTTPEQRAALDLSSLELAFVGAEPVRYDTLVRFSEAFADSGFRMEAFYPCYGLAEATLLVSGGAKATAPVVRRKGAADGGGNGTAQATMVGCGQSLSDQQILIVDPTSLTRCPEGEEGEIWVSGRSVAQGYWNRQEETAQIFGARLKDTGAGPFLRTGDLGVLHNGELFITGRLKDMIILDGRNHYPQDIELTVEQSHPALQPSACAAFSIDEGGSERLVVAAEVNRRWQPMKTNGGGRGDEIVKAIRKSVSENHQVRVHAVALLRAGTIPKTSSGKIQRHACRAGYLAAALDEWE